MSGRLVRMGDGSYEWFPSERYNALNHPNQPKIPTHECMVWHMLRVMGGQAEAVEFDWPKREAAGSGSGRPKERTMIRLSRATHTTRPTAMRPAAS